MEKSVCLCVCVCACVRVCVCLEKERDIERREKVTDSSIETDLMQKVGWDWGEEKKYVKEKI